MGLAGPWPSLLKPTGVRSIPSPVPPNPMSVRRPAHPLPPARPVPPNTACLAPCPAACRVLLEPVSAPRSRLDAGTHGTMGVGLGYAIAAAVTHPERGVVAVEGDSAFGFSGMECETICR